MTHREIAESQSFLSEAIRQALPSLITQSDSAVRSGALTDDGLAAIDPLERPLLGAFDPALNANGSFGALALDPLRTLRPLDALTLNAFHALASLNALPRVPLSALRALETLPLDPQRTLGPLNTLRTLDALALDPMRARGLLDPRTLDALRTLGPFDPLTLDALRTLDALALALLRAFNPLGPFCALRTLRLTVLALAGLSACFTIAALSRNRCCNSQAGDTGNQTKLASHH